MKLQDLFEAQDYAAMGNFLTKLYNNLSDKQKKLKVGQYVAQLKDEQFPAYIDWAKANLKRKDRITWFLRFLKLDMLGRIYQMTAGADPDSVLNIDQLQMVRDEMERLGRSKYERTGASIPSLEQNLSHLISLPVKKIQDYVFDKQSPDEIVNDLQKFEREWVQATAGTIDYNPDLKVFLKLDDGFAWYDLEASSSREEACAMGHCGNGPSAREGQTILSLRRVVEKLDTKRFEVCLTFILNQNTGMLGEMKGRGNDKPAARYHKYIVPLLKDDRIKGIAGGGYAPESNFSIWDLGNAEAMKLMAIKPELCTIGEYIKHIGVDDIIKRRLSSIFEFKYQLDGKDLVLPLGESLEKFFGDRKESSVGWLISAVMGDASYFSEVDMSPADIESNLSKENEEKLLKGFKQKYEKEAESTEDIEVDWTDIRSVLDYVQEFQSQDWDILQGAARSADEQAIQAEEWKFLDNLLKHTGVKVNACITIEDANGEDMDYFDEDTQIEATFSYDSVDSKDSAYIHIPLDELLVDAAALNSEMQKITHIECRPLSGGRDPYEHLMPYHGFSGVFEFEDEFNHHLKDYIFHEIFGKQPT